MFSIYQVMRYWTDVDVYRHKGFAVVGEQITEFGNGFVMDDYVMEKQLP